jgi:D-alanine transaminase
MASHLSRLTRSLRELRIRNPHQPGQWQQLIEALIHANGGGDLYVYLQISRGAEFGRNHAPLPEVEPTVFAFCAPLPITSAETLANGVACITAEDTRWARCDIKSVALLANVLGKQQAREAGAYEAWQVDAEGCVTEGTSTNAWIVTGDNLVVTRAADSAILNGVTRQALIEIIRREGYGFAERPFTVVEAKSAREAFLTSTTADLLPVVAIDGEPVANGVPGLLSEKLRGAYLAHIAEST